MSSAPASSPTIVYYQGWAEGGNYKVLKRDLCRFEKVDEVRCDITVSDDLLPALGSDCRATDSFHMTVKDGRISAVKTSSNDPPEAKAAFERLWREQPELFKTGSCRGIFADGPTPQDCIRAVVKGFRQISARRRM